MPANVAVVITAIATVILALAGSATPASAYLLNKASTCSPGQKWDTSRPVQVRLLSESALDYFNNWRGNATLADLVRLDADLRAVVDLYNAIPGSRLKLEFAPGIGGDVDLREPEDENYGAQTIVIGFTTLTAQSSSTAEAWAPGADSDGCTRTRAHILFRKTFNWIFGPPDDTTVDGRSFYTAAQPRPVGGSQARSFLGILTHEMGHAVGLAHPDDDYAVMAQGFRTWFRGPGHRLRTRLLPDDTAGVLALYGDATVPRPLDVSVTNSWYRSAEAQFRTCTTEIARVDAAALAIQRATGLPVGATFPAANIFKGEYADLFQALAEAQDALQACEDSKNAMQIDYCQVSSRGDDWADRLEEESVFCGVNARGSAYPPVSNRVCPGALVQLRYSLNNHTSLRDVRVRSEAWFSRDMELNVNDGRDVASPDVREFTLKAADSATIGQMFRVPANLPNGQRRHVFVRAVPHDVTSGASLWTADAEPWNNAIMLRHAITIDTAACR